VPVRATPAGQRAWRAPAALVAGVVALAGVWVVVRTAAPGAAGNAGPVLAVAPVAAPLQAVAARDASPLGDPAWQVVDGKLIRDARLDNYLRAHRGGAPVAMPGGATGRFETVVLER
jgi:sigma-E factor negative regulatory protein RseA